MTLAALEREHGPLPPTREVASGNGRHLWFACAGPIPSSAGRIGTGLDVRGDRAYIIAPPSVHPSGRTYAWRPAPSRWPLRRNGWCASPAPSRCRQSPSVRWRPSGRTRTGTVARRLRPRRARSPRSRRWRRWRPARATTRLNLASFRLFQLVAGGELDGNVVADRLVDACQRNGLIADDGLPRWWRPSAAVGAPDCSTREGDGCEHDRASPIPAAMPSRPSTPRSSAASGASSWSRRPAAAKR